MQFLTLRAGVKSRLNTSLGHIFTVCSSTFSTPPANQTFAYIFDSPAKPNCLHFQLPCKPNLCLYFRLSYKPNLCLHFRLSCKPNLCLLYFTKARIMFVFDPRADQAYVYFYSRTNQTWLTAT